MPLGSFPGKITVIDKNGIDFVRAIAYLGTQKIIGFDTETRPVFSPGQRHNHVALLQLSGAEKAYLFRVGSMGMRKLLCAVLSNPRILKVGAAVHDDVRGLQYYRKFEERGFVDLQKIAYEWGIRDKSVKKLAANILGVRISKSQQLSNWEADELSAAQQMYAATDAWVCREMLPGDVSEAPQVGEASAHAGGAESAAAAACAGSEGGAAGGPAGGRRGGETEETPPPASPQGQEARGGSSTAGQWLKSF